MSRNAFLRAKPHLRDQLNGQPFVVINGCRRLAAALQAGLPGLKYEIHDDWTATQIDAASIRENVHRLDLNPLHLGRRLAAMVNSYGSERKLAAALNKQPAWVNHRIGLTKLHPDLQTEIEEDRLMFKLARECVRLHPELQPKLAAGELPTYVAQAWLVDLRLKPDQQMARWQSGPPYAIEPDLESTEQTEADPTPERAPRRTPAIVIRLMERSPAELAAALRDTLSDDEVDELVKALRPA
jgi:ParB family chromosome partitioning protein